eukprot:maker-scaffold218_size252335-snap-gene-1.4 protein:Tk09650 transcript:maker-scaffold218_size252335-snap-gene-1.4-mRNA-1 annotation:"predicted protein"
MSDIQKQLGQVINDNKVVLFMKGSPDFPMCGFSGRSVQILKQLNIEFASVDVLSDENIRQGIKDYSSWPTVPQLYVDGEFLGGSDIMTEMFENGRSVQILKQLNIEFASVDVLSDENIRQGIKDYSSWPTVPQLYVDGEFLGGSDIMTEMFENGELAALFEEPQA